MCNSLIFLNYIFFLLDSNYNLSTQLQTNLSTVSLIIETPNFTFILLYFTLFFIFIKFYKNSFYCIPLVYILIQIPLHPLLLNYEFYLLLLNELLKNSLKLFHPTSQFLSFLFFYTLFIFFLQFLFYENYHYSFFILKQKFRSFFIIWVLTFLFGCWWADQESFWGGWWSWEVSELLLPYLLISGFYVYHFLFYKKYYFTIFNKFILALLYLVFYLLALFFYFTHNLHSFFVSSLALQLTLIFLIPYVTALYKVNVWFFYIFYKVITFFLLLFGYWIVPLGLLFLYNYFFYVWAHLFIQLYLFLNLSQPHTILYLFFLFLHVNGHIMLCFTEFTIFFQGLPSSVKRYFNFWNLSYLAPLDYFFSSPFKLFWLI